MGKKQDLLNVVRAAALSAGDPNLLWIIVGEGEERALLEREVATQRLSNLLLLPLQPVEELGQLYAAADVLLLNQKTAVKDAVIPSKLLTYILCAACPESVASHLIGEAMCGIVVKPEDPAALLEGAIAMRTDGSLRREMGANGRTYAERHYNKARVLDLYDQFFESLMEPPSAVAVAAD
jgi:colanic acid biosynthesis glycosyl transferase WcaI